jgi:hypothetical protein
MNKSVLPWNKIDEKKFEYLIRDLAGRKIPNFNWDLYLRKGHKQEGIDIYAMDSINKKYVCIQCKFYEKMNISALKECLKDFEDGTFVGITKKFIIATTADLQKKKTVRDFFVREELRFSQNSIQLELWDLENIEEKLRSEYDVVSRHFGPRAADDHCYSKNRHERRKYAPVENYLDRTILKVENFESENELNFYFGKREAFKLNEIFLSDYVTTRRICILGDAYQGKSTILEQLAYQLSESDVYIPILVKIKSHNIEPIKTILDGSYSYWNQYPTKDLVVILDGLDEVPKDKFTEYQNLITQFSTSFPAVNIVFSCRKLFFSHFKVYENAVDFAFYDLSPITDDQIEEFLKKLKGKKLAFRKYIEQNHLHDVLYHPFYLVKLVDMYMKSTDLSTLPKNKKEILNYLIGESFKPSEQRLLTGGILLAEEKNNYISCIKRMALVCQMLGVNALTSSDFEELFKRTQRELLTHSSFLTKQNKLWSFNIAFFQENLAALALLDMPYDDVLKIVTVGTIHKKLKTKWIQTIASLISLLENDDTRKSRFLELVEKDNIELLTFCDVSKFQPTFRKTILEKIIEKCIETNSFPQLARVDIIATFIKDFDAGLIYLLEIANSNTTQIIKILCWKIVHNFDNLLGHDTAVKKIILDILANAKDGNLAGQLVNILSKFKLLGENDIEEIVQFDTLNNSTEYLDALFELLINYKLVDKYYSIGLHAIDIYKKREHSQYGSQRTLEKFLLGTADHRNVFNLLTEISIQKWGVVYGDSYINNDKNHIISCLCQMAIEAHKQEPKVLIPVTVIAKYQLQRHYNKEHVTLFKFFEKTNTTWLFFRLCLEAFQAHDTLYLSYIITEDCFPYIFSEYEADRISRHRLEEWYSWLKYVKKDDELSEAFYQKLVAVSQSKFREDQELRNSEYLVLEKKRNENDVKYIQSQSAFIDGLNVFFDAYGHNTIPKDETFVGTSQNRKRRLADSTFISNFFLYFDTEEITLEQCVNRVNDSVWFEYFRAKEIYRYNFPSDESKSTLVPILQGYYNTVIRITDFKNSIRQRGNTYGHLPKQKLLASIFKKYRFKTPDEYLVQMLWLISDGFNHLKQSTFINNQTNSLSSILLDAIDGERIVQTVLKNIKSGIEADVVLSSHLEICRHLRISEVTELLLRADIYDRFEDHQRPHLVEIYLELRGDTSKLLSLFKKIQSAYQENNYLYAELAHLLIEEYTDVVSNSLISLLEDNTINIKSKIKFAGMLTNAGREKGFAFLVKNLTETCEVLDRFQGSYSLNNISTSFALNEISKLKEHILDEDVPFNSREFYSTKDFILHNVYQLAKKGEDDLREVEHFLNVAYQEFKSSHSNASELLFHIGRILEIYRDSDKTTYQTHELKKLLSIEVSD